MLWVCKEDTRSICYHLQPDKGRTIKSSDEGVGYCASLIPNQEMLSSEWVMLKADGDCKHIIRSSYSTWNTTLYVHPAGIIHLLFMKGLVYLVHKH